MSGAFEAIQVTERVWWVGAIDWTIRNFHGYLTSRGTTYNAFLIRAGDETILVDAVKAPFYDEMMARIASVVEPRRITTVISNHAEMDHSGALPRVLHGLAPDRVVASKNGIRALAEHFHWQREIQQAADGERLVFGDAALTFYETRMLHWPDSMVCHLEGDGVLFTNDAFGMHLASARRFADELESAIVRHEAAKYYANILLPFSPLVRKVIERLGGLDLDLKVLAPDHGPLWRQAPGQIVGWYDEWAQQKPTDKAVVVYDTMWDSTARMARSIGDGLRSAGMAPQLMPLSACHRSDVATEVLEAGALIVGAPTMNNNLYPTMADVMVYLKGLRPRNLVGAAFGSFGWSGEAVRQLEQYLDEMKIERVAEGLKQKYVPDGEALAACRDFGQRIGSTAKEKVS